MAPIAWPFIVLPALAAALVLGGLCVWFCGVCFTRALAGWRARSARRVGTALAPPTLILLVVLFFGCPVLFPTGERRFELFVAAPAPPSVKVLDFAQTEDYAYTWLRFAISPTDLHKILASDGYRRCDRSALRFGDVWERPGRPVWCSLTRPGFARPRFYKVEPPDPDSGPTRYLAVNDAEDEVLSVDVNLF